MRSYLMVPCRAKSLEHDLGPPTGGSGSSSGGSGSSSGGSVSDGSGSGYSNSD